jgi:DNA sulfur modification protein DndE
MFSHIKTSKENKEVVTQLTNKLSLGAENVIARIAFSYSISNDEKLDLKDLKNSGGKEYSKAVLFGNNYEIYLGLILKKYNIHSSNKDFSKYVKIHIDNGLELLNNEINSVSNIDGYEFLMNKIQSKL